MLGINQVFGKTLYKSMKTTFDKITDSILILVYISFYKQSVGIAIIPR